MAMCPVGKNSKQERPNSASRAGLDVAPTDSGGSSTIAAQPSATVSSPSWEWAWPWHSAAEGPMTGVAGSQAALEVGGVYLRGVSVPNSPARSLSEWHRALRGGVRKSELPESSSPTLQQIFQKSELSVKEEDGSTKNMKMLRKPTRRVKAALQFLDDEQASGYISEDEEPEADHHEKNNSQASEAESPEDEEGSICSTDILREINDVVERSELSRRMSVPLESPQTDWEPEPLGPLPTPDELVSRAGPALALPLAAWRQRRRSSQMAAQRLQTMRQEIDSKLAEIEEKISKENLPAERLTYAYVMHKFKSIAGDVESSDDDQRVEGAAAGTGGGSGAHPPRSTMWAGGAAEPIAMRCVNRRPFTAPQALMRRRLAGAAAAAGLIEQEEQPASMPATGDEASTASASPEARSPVPSRRRRVRKASAGRRRSQEPPGSSSSSSVSSSPSSHNRSARGRWRDPLSPLRVLPSSMRKRPSISRVTSAAVSHSAISPLKNYSFLKARKF